jgi:5'-methylthioadenosine phosphorylase
LGADLIGMTNATEAKLVREAEICYSTIALSTDYDCWKDDEHVNVKAILETMKKNVSNAQKVIRTTIEKMSEKRDCACANALMGAIMTDKKMISEDIRKRMEPIAGKYFR